MRKALHSTGIFSILLFICSNVNAQVQEDWVRKFVGLNLDNAAGIAAGSPGNVWICGNNNWALNNEEMYTVRYNANGLQTAGFLYNPTNLSVGAAAIGTDPVGNVYVAGKARPNNSTSDIVVIKYSSSAIQQWITFFNTPQNYIDDVTAMAVDAAGNIYLTGSVVKEEPFSYDYLTLKINTAGVVQWHRLYNGTANGIDIANDIAVDGSGNVYVTGQSMGQVRKRFGPISTGYDFVTIKYSTTGNQDWIGRYRKSNRNDEAKALALDASGNVYVTGTTSESTNNLDGLTVKYRNNGNIEWIQSFSGPGGGHDQSNDIVVDGSGNAYVAGSSTNTSGEQDVLAIKYNTSGVLQWTRTHDVGPGTSDFGVKMGIDIFGSIYIAAQTSVPGVVNSDFLTMRYSPSGIQSWAVRYNGPEDDTDVPTSMVVVQPDPGSPVFSLPNVYVYGRSASDVITIKYSQPIVIGGASELEPLPGLYNIGNTPNPFHSSTNINYELPEEGKVSLIVYDVMGRKVSTLVDGKRSAGTYVERFDAGRLSDGVYHYQYIVNVKGKEFRQTKSMVLQR